MWRPSRKLELETIMYRSTLVHALTLLILIAGLFALAAPANADQLSTTLNDVERGIYNQIDDFAIDSCDPPCEGLICCDNGVCVHTVLACGFYPIQIDSFRTHGSPRAQMAGYATQGVLAAEIGREARLWFGLLDGDDWRQLGVPAGHYELVLQEGGTMDHAEIAVVNREGRQVARLGGHFWVFSSALDVSSSLDWNLSARGLEFAACHDGNCVQLEIPLRPRN